MKSFTFLIVLMCCGILSFAATPPVQPSDSAASTGKQGSFSMEDLEYRTFRYFWELADSVTGFIPDRYPTRTFSSIAATGFGLAAYIDGVERQYIRREVAAARVLKTLRFLVNLPQGPQAEGVGGYKGFFYHFLDMRSGLRYKNVELSTIDTGLLLAGILACCEYFDGGTPVEVEIRQLANSLYERIDWEWALNGTDTLSMGWHPESGFINSYWRGYNEAMVLVIMAIGAPRNAIPASCWNVWTSTYRWDTFMGYEHVNFGPLFGHQYSHIFIDFKGIADQYMREKGIDYFENSRRATLAQQKYGMANPGNFIGYDSLVWGLTACDGPGYVKKHYRGREVVFEGYAARGAASDYLTDDGTIAPTAVGGSVPFAPEVCIPALEAMYNRYGSSIYGEYGFFDAFNPSFTTEKASDAGWVDIDYLGIDQGPIILMIANHRNGLIWNLFKRNPHITEGLKKAGFSGGWLD